MKICTLKGDGIGPEIMDSALDVLTFLNNKYELNIECIEAKIGGDAIDTYGSPLPQETIEVINQCDGVLLGAVGGPKWNDQPPELRPEKGLLQLRKHLNAYCNIRPITSFDALKDQSPVRYEGKLNLVFIRELTGGIYFGNHVLKDDVAEDTLIYTKDEIRRIAHQAFEYAAKRDRRITSVDKANVLAASRLWRKTVDEMTSDAFKVNHMYVDNAAMQLILNPSQFDVILTSNMFGDILSDEASVLAGSIGVLPSASVGDEKGLFEPIHGSAPDIAGQNKANPIGMILSLGMLLNITCHKPALEEELKKAIDDLLNEGCATGDLGLESSLTTQEFTRKLIKKLDV